MQTLKPPGNGRPQNTSKSPSVETSPLLSRSPHPYHRRGLSLVGKDEPKSNGSLEVPPRKSSTQLISSESSESGTEADDERGPLLKGLPAPPLRARKGLRGSSPVVSSPIPSPLPTPPIKLGIDGFFDWSKKKTERHQVDEYQTGRQKEYAKRKLKELVRRTAEGLLFCCIGATVWRSAGGSRTLVEWLGQLRIYILVTFSLYALYPIRLSFYAFQRLKSIPQAVLRGFYIPSRFDPGPLLYPVGIPVLTAISLFERNPAFLPVSIAAGLSAIPSSVTSFWRNKQLDDYFHWTISLLPFGRAMFREWGLANCMKQSILKCTSSDLAIDENIALIYPLHQAVLSILEYLTTTSLDPAELHLLATALINLFLFASSPQSSILKALILVGGFCLFLSCRHILRWEVSLARIPNWKLVRSKSLKDGFFHRLDRAICSYFATSPFKKLQQESSDSDDPQHYSHTHKIRRSPLASRSNGGIRHVQTFQPASATETMPHEIPMVGEDINGIVPRRATTTALDQKKKVTYGTLKRPRRTPSVHASFFLTLTFEQAMFRKYLYAGLAYIAVATTILMPVRYYVSEHALSGHEPFGWALGYLLGNWSEFRFWVVSNNLENWISLPLRSEEHYLITTIEDFRQYLGAANTRLLICGYCLVVLAAGIIVVLRLSTVVEVDTRRKVFHGIMVAMLLPTIFIDPCFIALALVLILAIFLLLDLFRASQLPPISRPLTNFLAPYVDGRDHRGPVIVSHIFLLIGCAIPLWLSLAGESRTGNDPWTGWDVVSRDLSMISGVVCVGMGDAAASLIGRRFGRTKWFWEGGKSVEGSLAFTVAVTVGLMAAHAWLHLGGWQSTALYNGGSIFREWFRQALRSTLPRCILAGLGASLLESTLTAANDNVVVPVGLWLLVRGLQI